MSLEERRKIDNTSKGSLAPSSLPSGAPVWAKETVGHIPGAHRDFRAALRVDDRRPARLGALPAQPGAGLQGAGSGLSGWTPQPQAERDPTWMTGSAGACEATSTVP